METVKYPIGIQDFEKIRSEGYLYIDKTALLYKMADTGSYYFLSRPRRFGKSLMMSTLEAYFKGKKHLFEGLAMERLEKEWKARPVFHLDLNTGIYDTLEGLTSTLDNQLTVWERQYAVDRHATEAGARFLAIIKKAAEQSGERVVILIDEYDKPLLHNIGNEPLQDAMRTILRSLYSVLKTYDRYIRFALLTGVSRFGKLSVFSDLNNLKDISMDARYVELCGITETEMLVNLKPQLQVMAGRNGLTEAQMLGVLRKKYDGYHFEHNTVGLYNPFSLLSAFDCMTIKDYWFDTGTPSFLVKVMQRNNYDLNRLAGERQTADKLNSIDDAERNPVPLLYQSGYLTIKDYDTRFRKYILGFPNEEVENGFVSYLLPCYVNTHRQESDFFVEQFVREVEHGEVESFMKRLQTMLADNSYQVQGDKEIYFQNTMFVIFKMMGFYTEVERTTSYGRIDMVIKTARYIYVIEMKLDGSAEDAVRQIDEHGYTAPYAMDKRRLFKIGVNFDSSKRNISEWKTV